MYLRLLYAPEMVVRLRCVEVASRWSVEGSMMARTESHRHSRAAASLRQFENQSGLALSCP